MPSGASTKAILLGLLTAAALSLPSPALAGDQVHSPHFDFACGPIPIENVTIPPFEPDDEFDSAREERSFLEKISDFFSNEEILNAKWGTLRLFIPSLLVLPIVLGFLYVWRRKACSEE